ncbi:Protein tonB, putative [Ricinus communis]|uniref:Protein tonB, putative n=1 Tax=Ricinus communis TaxID=3988 RepID=B9TC25_RICCO|nr:Protein tonB, putative [Ricinus communis]
MAYTSRKTIPQQLTGIGFVVALHIVVIYILASGLGKSIVEVALPPIETKVIEEEKAAETEPPPPPPKMETVPPYVPPPDFQVAAEPTAAPAHSITTTSTPKPAAPPAPAAVETVLPKSNPRRPNDKPAYPASERRAGHEGVVILQLYVLDSGKVGEAKVEKSSGFPALDEAAVKEALRSWRFVPGTKGGKPESMWFAIQVRFSLSDR